MNVQKGFHRPVQTVDQGNGSGNGTYGKRWVPVPDDQKASCKIDQQRTDLCKDTHDDHEPFTAAGFFQGQIGNFFIQSHKPAVFFLLAGKKFYQHRSADRQGLIDHLVHLIVFGLAFCQQGISGLSGLPGRKDQKRNDDDPDDRQLPAHGK